MDKYRNHYANDLKIVFLDIFWHSYLLKNIK